MAKVITKRRPKDPTDSFSTLGDADRYDILRRYRQGEQVASIAKEKNLEKELVKAFVAKEIKDLSVVQEVNKLLTETKGFMATTVAKPIALINEEFLEHLDDSKEVYAFYYAMTGSNEYALQESKLDKWLPLNIAAKTKRYTLSVRGKFIRDLPGIQKYINEIRDSRIKDMDLGKSFIQSELVEQIEQLKEISGDDPKYRSNLLKAIELLGRTMEAFSDKLTIETADPRSGLELLMKKAKEEIKGVIVYEPEED